MQRNLVEYYRLRARDNESVYCKPERQADLTRLRTEVQTLVSGLDVLEIACGTGYWTEIASAGARSITATDINASMLDVAHTKNYRCPVRFEHADLYRLSPGQSYDLLLGGFIWSHLPVAELAPAIRRLLSFLRPGGRAVFFDNRFVAGSSTPISRTDAAGNTYQQRLLADGSKHEVLKNFPAEAQVRAAFPDHGAWRWLELPYYWLAVYTAP
jgi:SAM-dependent methyltransferase